MLHSKLDHLTGDMLQETTNSNIKYEVLTWKDEQTEVNMLPQKLLVSHDHGSSYEENYSDCILCRECAEPPCFAIVFLLF